MSAERVPGVDEVPAALETGPSVEASPKRLPAVRESRTREKRTVLPSVPDVAGAAMRWMRPFVPPIIATAIDTTTKPLRAAREVFEETEEIHFSLRRSHRVTVTSEATAEPAEQWVEATTVAPVENEKTRTTRIERPKRQAHTEIHTSGGRRQLPPADS